MRVKYWFKSWAHENVCWCRAAAFVSVLVFGYMVVRSLILNVLITFFIDAPINYHLVKAARYVNIAEGASASLVIAMAYFSEAHFSHFKIISCSVSSSIFGLVLFFLNYKLWGNNDLFYLSGILLLAVGEAGLRPLLNEFLVHQLTAHKQLNSTDVNRILEAPMETGMVIQEKTPVEDRLDDAHVETPVMNGIETQVEERIETQVKAPVLVDRVEDAVKAQKSMWWIVAWVCNVIATFVVSSHSWKTIFVSSMSVLAGTFIFFLFGISFYHSKKFTGVGSSLFNFIPVVKASLLKWHLNYPSSPDRFFENDGNETHLSPRCTILRWLDKAAIIETSGHSEGEQVRAGRLCKVEKVKESKLLLKMIPMWSTFLVFGLVASTGDTFSSEQGSNLATRNFTLYLIIFLKTISAAVTTYLYDKFLTRKRFSETQLKLYRILRICSGMMLCTIVCAVAWRVEVHRLQIVDLRKKKPNEEVQNMSIFWLAPQYCLLGLMQGSGKDGLDEFMIGELPKSLRNYASAMNQFVIDGLGNFLGILFVHANRNLFSTTLNDSRSRLDVYYWRLMIVSYGNMCYYFVIAIIYGPIRYLEVVT